MVSRLWRINHRPRSQPPARPWNSTDSLRLSAAFRWDVVESNLLNWVLSEFAGIIRSWSGPWSCPFKAQVAPRC